MPADEHGALGRPREREPLVPRRVDRLLGARLGHEAPEPRACLFPRVRPCDALRPVLVPGERAELLQLRDRSLRIDPHGTTLTGGSGVGCSARDVAHRFHRGPDRGARARAHRAVGPLGGLSRALGGDWLDEALSRQRDDDASPARHRRRVVRSDSRRRAAARSHTCSTRLCSPRRRPPSASPSVRRSGSSSGARSRGSAFCSAESCHTSSHRRRFRSSRSPRSSSSASGA